MGSTVLAIVLCIMFVLWAIMAKAYIVAFSRALSNLTIRKVQHPFWRALRLMTCFFIGSLFFSIRYAPLSYGWLFVLTPVAWIMLSVVIADHLTIFTLPCISPKTTRLLMYGFIMSAIIIILRALWSSDFPITAIAVVDSVVLSTVAVYFCRKHLAETRNVCSDGIKYPIG